MTTPVKEEQVHQFLKNNSVILGVTSIIEPISKFPLGSEFVTDFVIREIPDGYILVEIERPSLRLFKKTNPPERTDDFNHAIQQLENWKAWVGENHPYISKKLDGISPNPMCWLIAGRRTNLSEFEQKRLKEINEQYTTNYKIFTYDDLIDRVRAVIRNLT
ncbi:Shedu anti-phage system protein SduA domain-containing protein [Chloroflexota bacterium]